MGVSGEQAERHVEERIRAAVTSGVRCPANVPWLAPTRDGFGRRYADSRHRDASPFKQAEDSGRAMVARIRVDPQSRRRTWRLA